MKRDPIARFEDSLINEGLFTEQDFLDLGSNLEVEIRDTLEWAKSQEDPDPNDAVSYTHLTLPTTVDV